MKTSELTGPALGWAAARAAYDDGRSIEIFWREVRVQNGLDTGVTHRFHPHENWSQGGPIIEREMLTVGPAKHQGFMAWAWPKQEGFWGDTPLIAAMRCFVASKLGTEVEIPEELTR